MHAFHSDVALLPTLHLQATAHCHRTRALSMLYNMNWSPYSANTHGVDNVLSSYSIKMLYTWRVWALTPNVWIWKSGPTWCIMVDLSHHSMLEHAMRCVYVCLPVCLCVCVSVYLSFCLSVCVCVCHIIQIFQSVYSCLQNVHWLVIARDNCVAGLEVMRQGRNR